MSYSQGTIRRNIGTGMIAVRTMFSDNEDQPTARLAWMTVSAAGQARHARTADVEGDGWEDAEIVPISGS